MFFQLLLTIIELWLIITNNKMFEEFISVGRTISAVVFMPENCFGVQFSPESV